MVKMNKDEIKGITSFSTYESGELELCKVDAYNVIQTKYGKLIPQYEELGVRRKDAKAFSLHKNGMLKSISLNEQTVLKTPIGEFPAELATFYEDGSINSLFPLNGRISFSWSVEEEGKLAQIFDFNFPFGSFSAKISGLRFYKQGKLRSLILWPGETIEVNAPVGKIWIRIGFKLFKEGMIESLEPASPYLVNTPIGFIKAYDTSALAVDADKNSMRFDKQGNLVSLVTAGDIIIISKSTGERKTVSSRLQLGLMDDDFVKCPITISFQGEVVKIDDGKEESQWIISKFAFEFVYDETLGKKPCYGDCSACTENDGTC